MFEPNYLFKVKCKYGKEINWETEERWGISLIGLIRFNCPCGRYIELKVEPKIASVSPDISREMKIGLN